MNEMEIEKLGSLFLRSAGVTTDSRAVKPGQLFFALRGENFDGNQYASGALEAGALAAVVDDPDIVKNDQYIFVENSLQALQALARWYRQRLTCPVIGITGSNGKTTTKELIARVLNIQFKTHFTQGNLNNHIGVPLTLLNIPTNTEMIVVEMGANHPGEIDFLSRIAQPDYGLITNIGRAHLEGFGGYEGVIRTKTELYRYIHEKGGSVFVNGSDTLLMKHSEHLQRILYNHPDAIVNGEIINDEGYLTFKLFIKNQSFDIQSQLVGSYNMPNLLAAAAIGQHFGVKADSIAQALATYTPTNNRSQLLTTPHNRVIMDAYNANPSSMAAALQSFKKQPFKPKAVILGEMLELGSESLQEHQNIAQWAASGEIDEIFLAGEGFREAKVGKWFENTLSLKEYLEKHPLKGYLILVKGSRGNKLEQIIDVL
jgi:UDP-N-acetylmuramoyl-tripeptide--D-alanyl-D-alanine ligase